MPVLPTRRRQAPATRSLRHSRRLGALRSEWTGRPALAGPRASMRKRTACSANAEAHSPPGSPLSTDQGATARSVRPASCRACCKKASTASPTPRETRPSGPRVPAGASGSTATARGSQARWLAPRGHRRRRRVTHRAAVALGPRLVNTRPTTSGPMPRVADRCWPRSRAPRGHAGEASSGPSR